MPHPLLALAAAAVVAAAPTPLTLEACQRLAFARNPELAAADLDARLGALEAAQAAHRYGFTLEAAPVLRRSNEPTNQTFLTGGVATLEEWSQAYPLALRQTLTTGGSWALELRDEIAGTNSQRVDFNPSFKPQVGLRLAQPLLRNAWGGAIAIGLAEVEAEAAALRTADRRAQIALDLATAYWDWVAAREEIRVREASLGGVRGVLAATRRKVGAGVLAPADTLQAEAAVAVREAEVIDARRAAAVAEERVRTLIGPEPATDVAIGPIAPADRPAFVRRDVADAAAWAEAAAQRPDLRLARLEAGRQAQVVEQARNGMRPQLDLLARASTKSVGASAAGTAAELPQLRYLDLEAGVFASWPLGANALADEHEKARLRLARANAALAAAENGARGAVRIAVLEVAAAARRVAATGAARRLSEAKLAAERKKLDAGMSTAFQVLTFQTDVEAASLAEVRAMVQHLQAQARYDRATGEPR